jgi:hypothetical protein
MFQNSWNSFFSPRQAMGKSKNTAVLKIINLLLLSETCRYLRFFPRQAVGKEQKHRCFKDY